MPTYTEHVPWTSNRHLFIKQLRFGGEYVYRALWFSTVVDIDPQGTFSNVWNTFVYHNWGSATGIYVVDPRSELSILQWTGQLPSTKNYMIPVSTVLRLRNPDGFSWLINNISKMFPAVLLETLPKNVCAATKQRCKSENGIQEPMEPTQERGSSQAQVMEWSQMQEAYVLASWKWKSRHRVEEWIPLGKDDMLLDEFECINNNFQVGN